MQCLSILPRYPPGLRLALTRKYVTTATAVRQVLKDEARRKAIIEGRGCQLIYLPAYSPDLTPIEGMFSKVKTAVRRAGKREQEALVGAIGMALGTVTPRDATGWFSHCGYAMQQAQPL